MAEDVPDFWFRGRRISLIDEVSLVDLIARVNTIDTITNVGTLNRVTSVGTVDLIDRISFIDTIDVINLIRRIQAIGPNPDIYGDGSDGDVTITADTTLTRDMNYRNLTVNAGFVLNTANYRVRCTGTLSNHGRISAEGAGGVGGVGGIEAQGGGGLRGVSPDGTIVLGGGGGGGAGAKPSLKGGDGGNGGGFVYIAAPWLYSDGLITARGFNGLKGADGDAYQPATGSGGGGGGGFIRLIYKYAIVVRLAVATGGAGGAAPVSGLPPTAAAYRVAFYGGLGASGYSEGGFWGVGTASADADGGAGGAGANGISGGGGGGGGNAAYASTRRVYGGAGGNGGDGSIEIIRAD